VFGVTLRGKWSYPLSLCSPNYRRVRGSFQKVAVSNCCRVAITRGILMNGVNETRMRLIAHYDIAREACERTAGAIKEVATGSGPFWGRNRTRMPNTLQNRQTQTRSASLASFRQIPLRRLPEPASQTPEGTIGAALERDCNEVEDPEEMTRRPLRCQSGTPHDL
jgi:hypothetical protein